MFEEAFHAAVQAAAADNVEPDPDPDPVKDPLPMSFCVAGRIQGQNFRKPLVALFDSGSTSTWINKKSLPKGIQGYTVANVTGTTLAGTFSSTEKVCLQDVSLPEFHSKRTLPKCSARVFHADCRYDIIVGRDVLRSFGILLDFKTDSIVTDSISLPMRLFPTKTSEVSVVEQLIQDFVDRCIVDDEDNSSEEQYVSTIKDSKYEAADPVKIADACKHLSMEQRLDLAELLAKFPILFNNELKVFTDEKIHLDIDPKVSPHRSRAYSVPQLHLATFKKELERLVSIGVLEKCGRADWVSGTFIIPKKDGRVRWVSDFRALNKAIKRKFYPLPKINEILARRKGYKFLSKLDISMQYYTFELDDETADLCTIATPFGLYRYRRLPMGVSAAPDIAQEVMERLLGAIEELEIYIDDLAVFSDDWRSHIKVLEKLLSILQEKGFTINPLKCEWGVQETDFLGHWLTPTGVRPWKKKIDAILRLRPPTNIKELRSFLGMVTYYRDMWPRRSHVLAPLTELLGSKVFVWNERQETAFQEMRALLASDAILTYPDHNLPFEVETDASDYQLGAVIKQEGRPVAYYSRKLSSAQKNYTTIEKELLSVVETLRVFRSMLLGAKITVYTDHRNLTHKLTSFTTQRVMRWRLLLEEYGPTFAYKKGTENVIADAMSRVPTEDEERCPAMPETRCVKVDDLWTECLWAMPKFDEQARHPFHFETIAYYQNQVPEIMALPQVTPDIYSLEYFGSAELVCKIDTDLRLIVLTDAMLPRIVTWYHLLTVHSEGMNRLEASIRRHFWHPHLREEIRRQLADCAKCQEMKKGAVKIGQLAPRDAPAIPWLEVHVDQIGPWTFKKNGLSVSVRALTMIDPVTNLVEIVRVHSTKTDETTRAFLNTWIARYPLPYKVITDGGPEFSGHEWDFMMMDWGLKRGRISSHTPTANAVIESTHQTMGQILRTVLQTANPRSMADMDKEIERAIAITLRACRCASSSALQGLSPGSLTFGRDMNLNIPIIADIISISENRQLQTDLRLMRANQARSLHEYKVGAFVWVNNHFSSADKLKPPWVGPFKILQVHTNGSVTVERGQVHERISIRRIKPSS